MFKIEIFFFYDNLNFQQIMESIICPICTDELNAKDCYLTHCKHKFHNNCFRSLYLFRENKVLCPICRADQDLVDVKTKLGILNDLELFVKSMKGRVHGNIPIIRFSKLKADIIEKFGNFFGSKEMSYRKFFCETYYPTLFNKRVAFQIDKVGFTSSSIDMKKYRKQLNFITTILGCVEFNLTFDFSEAVFYDEDKNITSKQKFFNKHNGSFIVEISHEKQLLFLEPESDSELDFDTNEKPSELKIAILQGRLH